MIDTVELTKKEVSNTFLKHLKSPFVDKNYNVSILVEPTGALIAYNEKDKTFIRTKRIHFLCDKNHSNPRNFDKTDSKAVRGEVLKFMRSMFDHNKSADEMAIETSLKDLNKSRIANEIVKFTPDYLECNIEVYNNVDFVHNDNPFDINKLASRALTLLNFAKSDKPIGSFEPKIIDDLDRSDIGYSGIIKDNKSNDDNKFDDVPEPKNDSLDKVKVPTNLSIEDMISVTVRNAVKSDFTADMLKHVLHEKLNEYGIKPKVKALHITTDKNTEPVTINEATHCLFPKVLKYASLGLNVFLTGESGSGKTYCAELVAKALNLDAYSKSVGIETGMHEFMGFMTANGNVVKTDFQKAFSEGGVFLVDEIDGGNPNVLLALNQALSSEYCTFASGREKKHKDFVCIAAANTWGFGATADYVGRNPIDGATLDRFVFVNYTYDEDLERNLANNDAWVDDVQAMRKKAKDKRVKVLITPRASIMGAKLLANGVSKEDVLTDLVYKGMTKDEINLIKV